MKYIVVDLGRVPSGSLSPSSAYVALSWSRGRDSIRLLKDFDDKLFTTTPIARTQGQGQKGWKGWTS